jgi:hypothetical protein
MEPLRNIICELATYLGMYVDEPDPDSENEIDEPTVTTLRQTSAEQPSALAQNANSIATLTHILESKLPLATLVTAQSDTINATSQNDLSASIHAPAAWSTTMKRSDNPLPIKPTPKKKVTPPPSHPSMSGRYNKLWPSGARWRELPSVR